MSYPAALRGELPDLWIELQRELETSTLAPAVLNRFVTQPGLAPAEVARLTRLLEKQRTALTGAGLSVERSDSSAPDSDRPEYQPRHASAESMDNAEADCGRLEGEPAPELPRLVEYDEFGLPIDMPEETAPRQQADAVDSCVGDLMDDWQRQGAISLTDIHRATDKRKLSASQIAEVIKRMTSLGAYVATNSFAQLAQVDEAAEAPRALPDAVGAYLQSIAKFPLLRAEDEVRLGRRIRAGQLAAAELADLASPQPELARLVVDGRTAHAELVCANLRLAVNIARHPRYRLAKLELLDRIQYGNLGLIRAADKFDYGRGFKFSTYATWWIRHFIERGLADDGRLIRIPVHMIEKINRMRRVEMNMTEELGRPVTVSELATQLGEDPGSVAAMRDIDRSVASLDAALTEDGELTLADVIDDAVLDEDPADVVAREMTSRAISDGLRELLSEREYVIVKRRFGLDGAEPCTLEEIGEVLGVTRERVRQIQSKVLSKLRGSSVKATALRAQLREDAEVREPRPDSPLLGSAPPGADISDEDQSDRQDPASSEVAATA